ncbi:hypothetical protein A1359_14840 [Methylomonas lenta]|jgi:plasmid stabilization system protein ParE|uniref:Plasmid stabilization protein n=1 Tax=Methylomonas lenta TaxID=980561 RepID=A0A177N0L7_9GAMM|nr:type II toxin-antitoxin system RelE/ParE family toxin [Methylomonas lenta]OAI11194.1 hypothetical protein A1359_14840 [Methylomonas lenta]
MKIRILKSARQDLADGRRFYQQQSPAIGDYFLDSLFSDIESLLIHAGVHAVYFDRFYRLLSKRFPFALYYRLENQTILIYAVLDCRRSPAWIRKKLTNTL